jgi:hypothetical protein
MKSSSTFCPFLAEASVLNISPLSIVNRSAISLLTYLKESGKSALLPDKQTSVFSAQLVLISVIHDLRLSNEPRSPTE